MTSGGHLLQQQVLSPTGMWTALVMAHMWMFMLATPKKDGPSFANSILYNTLDRERIVLIEARKYAHHITRWIRTCYQVFDDVEEIDIFEMLLWQVAMSLSNTIVKNDKLGSVLSGCTPDNVAGALYDSLLNGALYTTQASAHRPCSQIT